VRAELALAGEFGDRAHPGLVVLDDLPVDRVAHEVGFATATSLRRHLAAEAGIAPAAYRRTFRASSPAETSRTRAPIRPA